MSACGATSCHVQTVLRQWLLHHHDHWLESDQDQWLGSFLREDNFSQSSDPNFRLNSHFFIAVCIFFRSCILFYFIFWHKNFSLHQSKESRHFLHFHSLTRSKEKRKERNESLVDGCFSLVDSIVHAACTLHQLSMLQVSRSAMDTIIFWFFVALVRTIQVGKCHSTSSWNE